MGNLPKHLRFRPGSQPFLEGRPCPVCGAMRQCLQQSPAHWHIRRLDDRFCTSVIRQNVRAMSASSRSSDREITRPATGRLKSKARKPLRDGRDIDGDAAPAASARDSAPVVAGLEHAQNEIVKLCGAQDRMRDAGGLDCLLLHQLAMVIGRSQRSLDADDARVDEVARRRRRAQALSRFAPASASF